MFPTRGWYNTLSAEVAEPRSPASENSLHALRAAARATTIRSGGRSCFRINVEGGLIATPRPARRADLRALLRRRHLRHPRLRAAARSGRSHPSLSPQRRRPRRCSSFRSAATCRSSATPRSSSRIFEKVGIRASCSPTSATPTTSRTSTAKLQRRRTSTPSKFDPCNGSARPQRLPRVSWASASAGSRRSARCASSGASRSDTLPGEEPIVFEFTIGNFF